MSETDRPKKDDILGELESIKHSLSDDEIEKDFFDLETTYDDTNQKKSDIAMLIESIDEPNSSFDKASENTTSQSNIDNRNDEEALRAAYKNSLVDTDNAGLTDTPNVTSTSSNPLKNDANFLSCSAEGEPASVIDDFFDNHTKESSSPGRSTIEKFKRANAEAETRLATDKTSDSYAEVALPLEFGDGSPPTDFETDMSRIIKSNTDSTFESLSHAPGSINTEAKKAPVSLPGQQSLFESASRAEPPFYNAAATAEFSELADNIKHTYHQREVANHTAEILSATASVSMLDTSELKPGRENPFLPQHVRKRLAENREQLESDMMHPASSSLKLGAIEKKTQPNLERRVDDKDLKRASGKVTASNAEHECDMNTIIDKVVNKHLPKIERELRVLLREKLDSLLEKPKS